jgi:outer membrane protein assembly factor BamB/predicted phosphohydrolase
LTLVFLACTGSGNDDKLRFAFLTDLHISPMDESSAQLALLVQEVNAGDFDLVVIAGDISNQGSYEELRNAKDILDQLNVPYYILPGNHETNWSESAGLDFTMLWGDDKFLHAEGDFVLAGINTGPFMRMGDGHVKQEDINWLREQLETSIKHDKQLLFFAHYPLAEGLDQWYEVTDILNTYNTPIAFCGHGHRQQLLNFDGFPGIMGRSLVLRGENIPGYNIIEIRNDSLFAIEKIIGKDLVAPNIALHLPNTSEAIEHLDVSGRPEYSINDIYPHVSPGFFRQEEASVFTGPLVLGDTLVVFGNSLGHLKAINIKNDTMLWEIQMEGPLYATPVYSNGNILMGGLSGRIYGIELNSGEISWEQNTKGPVVAGGLIEDGYYYGGSGSDGFYKINASNGEISWVFNDVDGQIQAQAAIHDDYLVFNAWDTHVYCLNKTSGELLWKWNNGRPVALLSPGNVVPVISNDKVFIVAPDRFMTAIDLATGEELWRTNKHQVRESMGVSGDRQSIFAKLMNDSIVAVSTKGNTAKTLWSLDAGFGYDHNPCPIVVKDNLLFAATKNGLVMAIDIHKQELSWKHKVSNSAINFLHAGDNKLWLTSADGKVVSLKYKQQ